MKFLFLIYFFVSLHFPTSSETLCQAEPPKSIEIIIPANGSSIDCIKTKLGKKAQFIVKGNSINIREGEFITLLLKPKNENKWLRISDSNKVEQNYLGAWSFNIDVEIGKRCKEAELSAIVSKIEIEEKEFDTDLNLDQNVICRSQKDFIITAQ